MKIKRSSKEQAFNVFNILLMCAVMFVCLYPMVHVINASLSDGKALMRHGGLLLTPLSPTLSSYTLVFRDPMITRGYLNTLFIVGAGVVLNVIMTSIGAYVLSRKNMLWQKHIFNAILVTMLFSGGTIPFYFTVVSLGLDNSLWSLILPGALNTFHLIIMRTSFLGLPDSLEESAKLDGAGPLTVLVRILLPLSLPILAVIVLYCAVGFWNSWFNAMLFIKERAKNPLQLVLRGILLQGDSSSMTAGAGISGGDIESVGESIKYTVIVVATLPILCIYPFLQKHFVKGVLIGAVKE